MLEELFNDYRKKGIKTLFTGVKGPVRDAMDKSHLIEVIGKAHFFMSVQEAVDFLENRTNGAESKLKDYVLQST